MGESEENNGRFFCWCVVHTHGNKEFHRAGRMELMFEECHFTQPGVTMLCKT